MCVLCAAVAGPEADIEVFGDSELYIISANETLTFEHTYTWWGESSSCSLQTLCLFDGSLLG